MTLYRWWKTRNSVCMYYEITLTCWIIEVTLRQTHRRTDSHTYLMSICFCVYLKQAPVEANHLRNHKIFGFLIIIVFTFLRHNRDNICQYLNLS